MSPVPPFNPGVVRERLEAYRRKLLDTSLRNRLINYRRSKRVGLDIVEEDPIQILRLLVAEGRTMTFTGLPDPVKKPERDC